MVNDSEWIAQPVWQARSGSLLLALPNVSCALASALLTGIRLHAKHEFHVTVVGRSLQRRLCNAAGGDQTLSAQCVSETRRFAQRCGHRWQVDPGPRFSLLVDPDWTDPRSHQRGRASLVQWVEVDQAKALYRHLRQALGIAIETPPFHITWMVAGDRQGIAVADQARLAQLEQQAVTSRDLSAAIAELTG